MPVIEFGFTAPGIALARLSRPEVRNALGTQSWPELHDALTTAQRERARAFILAGSDQVFSSGGDLRDAGSSAGRVLERGTTGRLAAAHSVLRAIAIAPFPVIAAVDGPAIGIGWSLALACDLIVAGEHATFAAPFLSRGVTPDGLLWWRLRRAVGEYRAAEILYSGRALVADEAYGLGLVTHLCGDQSAVEAATAIGATVASYPCDAVALTKQMIRTSDEMTVTSSAHLELATSALNISTGAPAEGRRAYLEKRPPAFG